jgi:hypothetical protein
MKASKNDTIQIGNNCPNARIFAVTDKIFVAKNLKSIYPTQVLKRHKNGRFSDLSKFTNYNFCVSNIKKL